MSYHGGFNKFNYNQYPRHVGLTDMERDNFINQIRHDNGCYRGAELKKIPYKTQYLDHLHTCYLYKKPEDLIAVGIAHIEYTGTGSDAAGHAVVVIEDTNTNECYIINFNSHIIQNTSRTTDRYITGGPLAKKRCGEQNVPNISKKNHLVTDNLQGGAPTCTLIAAANFKTIFEQCRNMDHVRAKFSGPELIQRLEDVKTLFGNRVIHKGTYKEKTVAEYIDTRIQILSKNLDIKRKQQMLAGQLTSPTPRQIPLAQTTVTQESHLPQLQPPASPARQPAVSPTAAQGSHLPPLNQNPRQVPGSRHPVGSGGRINPSTHTEAPSMRPNLNRVPDLGALARVRVVTQEEGAPARSAVPSRLPRNINLGGHGFSSH